jgi:hypothetical protein
MSKAIAIVAMGHSCSSYINEVSQLGTPKAKYDEVWTLNGLVGVLKADRVFMLDDFELQEARAVSNAYVSGMLSTAKEHPGPIYTSRVVPGYPALVEYPLQDVANRLKVRTLYLTNSVPFMVAMALAEGATKIGIYGCDYNYGDNRTERGRSCLEWWCGFAEARGVEIYVPATSGLLEGGKPPVYGYWAENLKVSGTPGDYEVHRSVKAELPSVAEVERQMSHAVGK